MMDQDRASPAMWGQNWLRERDCSLDAFIDVLNRDDESPPRFAAEVRRGIPLYDCEQIDGMLQDAAGRATLQTEWTHVLRTGAGVFVLQRAFADTRPVDDASAIFESIIREERERGAIATDHFAKAGANDRIWNAQEKLCLANPSVFADYFSNAMLVAVSEAWLGPGYQMTSQVNVVRPGGEAQQAHRDYHLGFQTVEEAERYPAHVHEMSALLTLQGAVAHSDMPVESGPTMFLPRSQRYREGYLAWRRADFRGHFAAHYVQLPLSKGDAVFFNPALFHAAGANRTSDVQRMANLLQISSVYGRAMEVLDRSAMCAALYPELRRRHQSGAMSEAQIAAVIASCAEGYPFPTNLDRDPPMGGLAPRSQQALMLEALANDLESETLRRALQDHAWRRRTPASEGNP
jgi:ectoine hydroxylase-related dioxygenase (phytanoyl-CoA dioxygenase family)